MPQFPIAWQNKANARASDAGVRANIIHIDSAEPELNSIFAGLRCNAPQALVMLEQPALGVIAGEIAERAC